MDRESLYCQECGRRYELRGRGGRELHCAACGGRLASEYVSTVGRDRLRSRDFVGEVVGGCRIKKALMVFWDSVAYQGTHLKLKLDVRVRIITNEFAEAHPFYIGQLLRQAHLSRSVRCPNVLCVIDVGRLPNCYFIITELAEGGSVRELLHRGRLRPHRALSIAEEVLRGLESIHAEGLTHGDLRPQSILLDVDGRAKLADVALPQTPRQRNQLVVTDDGQVVGSAYYTAPERVLDGRDGDIRSDLYSLGVSLYEMLSGRRPFDGDSALEIMMRHLGGPPPQVTEADAELPEEVCRFVGRLMALDPAHRPQTPSEALAELGESALALSRAGKMKTAVAALGSAGARRERKLRGAFWLVVCAVLVALAVVPPLWMYRDYRRGLNKPPAVSTPGPKKPVLVWLEPAEVGVGGRLPAQTLDAVRAMAACYLSVQPGVVTIDPFRVDELFGSGFRFGQVTEATSCVYVLRMAYSAGFNRWKWRLSFSRRGENERSVAVECATERAEGQGFAELERALGALLQEAAAELAADDLSSDAVRPFGSAAWPKLGRALRAERAGRLEEALLQVREGEQLAEEVPVLELMRTFYELALSWQEGAKPPPVGDLHDSESRGEPGMFARALRAAAGADEGAATAAFADYLSEYPGSARGYYLLGMWRLRVQRAAQEALLAFRHAVDLDPGYMPAAKACAGLLCQKGEEEVEAFLHDYASLKPPAGKEAALRDYCRALRGGQ